MLNKKSCVIISVVLFLLILPIFKPSLFAQVIPSYNVRNIMAGNVSDIQAQVLGSGSWGNLGLILRVSSTRTDSFDIIIPAGTLFGGLSPGSHLLNNENNTGAQSFLTVLGGRSRFPGGGKPELDQAANLNSYVNDVLIYALCYDVNLPVPDTTTVFNPTVDSLESIPRIAKMIQGFEKFDTKMQQIDSKIKANQTLTDDETRFAAFIDWFEQPGQINQTSFLKSGIQRKNKFGKLLPYAKFGLNHNQLETYTPEIRRETAQNVVWTMAPEDQDFSPVGVRNDISYALDIYDPDSLDNFIRPANSLLELLGLERRLLIVDSLRYPISHFIDYPPYYITWWDGAGAGWASRMSLPYESKYRGYKWQIVDISYYLQSDNSGTFQAAILENSNGSPGNDLMNQKTVSFPVLPDGDFVTVDVSSENIIVNGDFFIALFQSAKSNPAVLLSEAINGRAFGFDGVDWYAEAMSLLFQATLKLVDSTPATPSEQFNLPGSFALYPNYPNPFNPYTVIKFDVPVPAHITIKLFNPLGQIVKILVDQQLAPGNHRVTWDGSNQQGILLSSGVYFVQMKTRDYQKIQKITFLH